MFEAKLPRLSKPDAWDYTQKKTGDSHFGAQLKRQAKIAGNVAVFEMFYCEAPFKRQVKEMHDELSSFVWHSDALSHDKTRAGPTWTFAHLRALLGRSSLQIGDVLMSLCKCEAGEVISGMNAASPEQFAVLTSAEFGLSGEVLLINADDAPRDDGQSDAGWD